MAKKALFSFFAILLSYSYAGALFAFEDAEQNHVITSLKKIVLEDFPDAHNPSIIAVDKGYLMTFRFCPDLIFQPWLSHIGVVLLDKSFQPISSPKLLNTRLKNSKTPSQSEDARIFSYRGRLFVIYNDNMDIINPKPWERRDMFVAELLSSHDEYYLSSALKLVYEEKYNTQKWQKNWIPFEWEKTLLMTYRLNPHEVLYANLLNGGCYHCYETSPSIHWPWGTMRGSTPPLKVDGEFLAFFHSAIVTESPYSKGQELWHFFMGAYTFSAEPPFQITKMTPSPLVTEGLYNPQSNYYKRVVYPGGFVISDSHIYVAYGKDDCEIWIAEMDKEALKESLVPINGM